MAPVVDLIDRLDGQLNDRVPDAVDTCRAPHLEQEP